MHLELHDNSTDESTLCARVGDIDYDYQAEMWVTETLDRSQVVRWELHDTQGMRCVWERKPGSIDIPSITKRSPRFAGEWQKGPQEVALL